MARKCEVCHKADLIPSGCGCLNPECHNYVGKWKPCIAGYRDAKDPLMAIPDSLKALVHEAAQADPDKDVEAWAKKLGNDICQEPAKEKVAAEPPPKTVPKKRNPKPRATFD